MNRKLLAFLEKQFGDGRNTSGTNYSFYSPFVAKRKRKLEIDLNTKNGQNPWQCWISKKKGRNLFSLLKLVDASKEDFTELADILNTTYYNITTTEKPKQYNLELPKEYIPLYDKLDTNSFLLRKAINYLKNTRKLSDTHIRRYKIGVCLDGKYENRIIIPSYDIRCNLNYFVARDMFDGFIKYLNPPCSRDVVVFEMFINWSEPIIIVEGVFDAIRIGYNSIPLMGKNMLDNFKLNIIKNNVENVNICLDSDAYQSAIEMAEYLLYKGINVKLINITDGDPADLGRDKILQLIHNTEYLKEDDLFRYKVMNI